MSKRKGGQFQAANVLAVLPEGKRLWRFGVSGSKVTAAGDTKIQLDQKPSKKDAGRDWRMLIKPRVDIAWLPSDQVFLRAVTLPPGEPGEIPGMIEFQLEHLSPLPAAQIVWTVEALPSKPGEPRTAIVVIAARSAVEEYLGTLEQAGYIADQLEIPLVRELRSHAAGQNELRLIVDERPGVMFCLTAWFLDGGLRDIALFRLPAGEAGANVLADQLMRTAWAGEIGGWLQNLPQIHLQSGPEAAAALEPKLREWSSMPVRVEPRLDPAVIAELTVRESVTPRAASLVPKEIQDRHRQQFVDGLWVRGLVSAGVIYMACVFIYLAILNVQKYRLDDLKDTVNGMARRYTNTMQLKAQVEILQEQVALRYAALECYKAVVERLPETLTLEQLDFRGGHTLTLRGTASEESRTDITKFNSEMLKATANGSPIFAEVRPANIAQRGQNMPLSWDFNAELKKADAP
jgi:hypothetical protein